jgi:hypothetical protein
LAILDDRKKEEYQLAGTFRSVRGDVFIPPEEDPDFKNDISRLGLTSNQQKIRERQFGSADDESSPEGRRREEERKQEREFKGILEQSEALRRIDAEIARIRADIQETQRQIDLEDQHIRNIQREMTTLDAREQTILQQQQDLLQEIADADRAVEETRQEAAEIDLIYNLRKEEEYQDNVPQAVKDREMQMNEEEYQKHRETIKAEYEARGLGKEFEAQERLRYGGTDTPENNQALGARIHAAGMTSNLNAHLLEVLRRENPESPYLKTLDSAFIDVQRANEKSYIARERSYDLHGSEIQQRLDGFKSELDQIKERKEALVLEEKAARARKEDLTTELAQLRRQEIETLALREEVLKKTVNHTEKFQEKFNSGEARETFLKGKMTMAEYEKEMEESVRRGYIDTGTSCARITEENMQAYYQKNVANADPNYKPNAPAEPPINVALDSVNNTARTGTSASSLFGGGILSGQDLTLGFNTATTLPATAEEIAVAKSRPLVKPDLAPT